MRKRIFRKRFLSPFLRSFLMVAVISIGWAAAPAPAAVISHWSFDAPLGDKSVYRDLIGRNNATPKDSGTILKYAGEDAPFGGAVTLTAQPGSYFEINPITQIQKNSFTVAAWVNMSNTGPNFILTDWESFPHAGFVFGVNPLHDHSKATTIADLASNDINARSKNRLSVARFPRSDRDQTQDVPLNEWHHLAWVWDRPDPQHGTLTVYLDAKVIGSVQQFRTPVDIAINNAKTHMMRIGSQETGNMNFNGSIDELWIFSNALTADQVKNLMLHNDIEGKGPLAHGFPKSDGTAVAAVTPPALSTPPAVTTPPQKPQPVTPAPSTPVPPRTEVTSAQQVQPDSITHTDQTPTQTRTPATPAVSNAGGAAQLATPATGNLLANNATSENTGNIDEDNQPSADTHGTGSEAVKAGGSMGRDILLGSTPVRRGYGPLQMATIVTCIVMMFLLSSFLTWAFYERAKMRSNGRL